MNYCRGEGVIGSRYAAYRAITSITPTVSDYEPITKFYRYNPSLVIAYPGGYITTLRAVSGHTQPKKVVAHFFTSLLDFCGPIRGPPGIHLPISVYHN